MRIALVANTGWYLYNFRLNLMSLLVQQGHTVIVICPRDTYTRRISDLGIEVLDWSLSPSSRNPAREIWSITNLWHRFFLAKIDVVLSFTPKGNLYSGLVGTWPRRTILPNISGTGEVFSSEGKLQKLVRKLYKISLAKSPRIFFQNEPDRNNFIQLRLVPADRTVRLMGSGVDLQRFKLTPLPHLRSPNREGFTFLLAARMIRAKGIVEYVEAARQVKVKYPNVSFLIVGSYQAGKRDAICMREVEGWGQEGIVLYQGVSDDMPQEIAKADCVVLPSYYNEGVPRILLEASAMGRPCITTDWPGCRDAIENSVTGFLCRPKCSVSLAGAMIKILEMPNHKLVDMGKSAEQRMRTMFNEKDILHSYSETLRALASGKI